MIDFLAENTGTIIVGLLVLAAVGAVALSQIKKRRSGKICCSCGCKNCPSASVCHNNQAAKCSRL